MHSKPIWWPALKAFNKRNVEETSSVSKVGLNDRFYLFIIISCFLGIRGQQFHKSSWEKKKKQHRLSGAKGPSLLQDNAGYKPSIMGRLWFILFPCRDFLEEFYGLRLLVSIKQSIACVGRESTCPESCDFNFPSYLLSKSPLDPTLLQRKRWKSSRPHSFTERVAQAFLGGKPDLPCSPRWRGLS